MMDAANFRKQWLDVLKRAGITERIRPHDLRHANATMLLAQGVPMKIVAERLGHASTRVTSDIYSHVLPGMQSDAAAAIERALRDDS